MNLLKAKAVTIGVAAVVAVGVAMISAGPARAADDSTARIVYKVLGHVVLDRGHGRRHAGHRGFRHGHRHDHHRHGLHRGFGFGHGKHHKRLRRHGFGFGHGKHHKRFLRHGSIREFGRGHRRDETCRRVFKLVYDDYGRRIRIAGAMCTDAYGNAYIVPGSRYVVRR